MSTKSAGRRAPGYRGVGPRRIALRIRLISLSVLFILLSADLAANPSGAASTSITQTMNSSRFAAAPIPELANQRINDVLQDRNGLIWVATDTGLYRYDGVRMQAHTYRRSDPRSLSSNRVTRLFEDHQGVLWIGTADGGLNRHRPGEQGFQRYDHSTDDATSLSDNRVRAIVEDNAGYLWVGTDHGLNRLHEGKFDRYQHEAEDPSSLPHNRVSALLEDKRGNLWVGTNGGGIARFDKRQDQLVRHADGDSPKQVTRLYEDRQDRLWIASTDGGLQSFDRERQRFQRLQGLDVAINDLLQDAKGNLWIASREGLWLHNTSGFQRYVHDAADSTSIGDDRINRAIIDQEGVMWLATGSGLNRWNYLSLAFDYLNKASGHLQRDRVSAITEDGRGHLWVGSKNGSLRHIDRSGKALHSYGTSNGLTDNRVSSLLIQNNEHLWVGSASGVSRMSLRTETFESLATMYPAGFHSGQNEQSLTWPEAVTQLALHQNELWVGTKKQGLFRISEQGQHHYEAKPNSPQSLANNRILALLSEPGGDLWVATHDGTLQRFTDGNFFRVNIESEYGNHRVQDMVLSKDGTLWLGTAGGGLLSWSAEDRHADRQRLTHYADLPSNNIRALLEDQAGALWLSSNIGVTRFDPVTGQTRHFDRFDGLLGTRHYAGAKHNSRSGRLYFGGNRGLLGFYPNTITRLNAQPRILLGVRNSAGANIELFNNAGDGQLQTLRMNHATEYLWFEFAALNFVAPQQNRYAYRLVGFDEHWIDTQSARAATYTNLSPGAYRFEVRGANAEGIWSDEAAAIDIEVAEPGWSSAAALASYAIILAALVGFMLLRLQQELQRLRSSRRTLETQVELRAIELEERNRQLVELNKRLQEASITDPLTGLLNRRSFYEFVSREVASVERDYTGLESLVSNEKRHLFFMMIDLDEFKPINDTFGHHTGDHTLVQVAELLTSCAREADTVFRWGGDEFLIIGQVQHSQDLEILAERYRSTIADHRFDPKFGKALRLTASIGVAPYPFCDDNPGIATWEQAADIADLAAYLAKTHGKNAWVSTHGTERLTNQSLQQLQENLELLIESGMISAVTSNTQIPIPGANST